MNWPILTLLLVIQTGDHIAVPNERDNILTTPAESTVTGVKLSVNLQQRTSNISRYNDEMVYEMNHTCTADMKSSEAMIFAVMNAIFTIASRSLKNSGLQRGLNP